MKRLIIFIVSAFIITTMFSSCATILSGTTDKVFFKSVPSGAKVIIDYLEVGTTDNDIVVKRKGNDKKMVTFKKEGYEDISFKYEIKITGAYWLGLFGLGIPMIIDLGTGAAFKSKYEKYEKTLTPKK